MQTLNLTKKYERYPEYKDSGAEWLRETPKDWPIVPMRSVAYENTEKNFDGKCQNLLSLSYGKIIEKDINSNEGLLPESFNTYQIVKKGIIVFRLTDLQNDKRSLRVGYVGVEEPGMITSAYLSLKIDQNLHKKFAYYLFHSYDLQKVYYGMGGGVRQTLDFENFKYLPILLPKISEQTKIATYLDEKTVLVDQIIEKKKKLIELLREKSTAVINHAVTKGLDSKAELVESGVDWVGKIPRGWQIKKIKRVADLYTGNSLNDDKKISFSNEIDSLPYVATKDLDAHSNSIDFDNGVYIPKNDRSFRVAFSGSILLCIEGGSAGKKIAYTIRDVYFVNKLCSLKVSSDHGKYIYYFCKSAVFTNQFNIQITGLIGGVSPQKIKQFNIVVPPKLVQEEIAQYLDRNVEDLNTTVRFTEQSIELLQEFKSSLISHVVTGKIKI